jgi:thiopurine S-methyltransferase
MSIWHQRWNENRIGFHRLEANPTLTDHWSKLSLASDAKVLVPLCGKSLDMHWLNQQGHTVVGIELVEKAIKQFFDDASTLATQESKQTATKYSAENIHLYHADFFQVQPDEMPVEAWYDRAALVALPSTMRQAYVEQLLDLTTKDSKGLMVTFDYPQEEMQGPPFALPDSEVESLFSQHFTIERVQWTDVLEGEQRDLTRCSLSVFVLTRR